MGGEPGGWSGFSKGDLRLFPLRMEDCRRWEGGVEELEAPRRAGSLHMLASSARGQALSSFTDASMMGLPLGRAGEGVLVTRSGFPTIAQELQY